MHWIGAGARMGGLLSYCSDCYYYVGLEAADAGAGATVGVVELDDDLDGDCLFDANCGGFGCFGCVNERIVGFVEAELVVEVGLPIELHWPKKPAMTSSFSAVADCLKPPF